MANFITTKLSGDFEKALDKLEAKVRQEVLFSGAAGMAQVIKDEVVLNLSRTTPGAPGETPGMVTGTLRSAIYQAHDTRKTEPGVVVYKVSQNKGKAPHWHWLEYGNSRMAARPYMRPALSAMGRAVAEGLSRMKKRFKEVA